MSEKINIYGIDYNNVTPKEAADMTDAFFAEDGNHLVVTPNAEIAYMAKNDINLGEIINNAELTVADGIGVVYASKIYRRPVKGKVAGVELGEEVLARSVAAGRRVFFLGGKPGIAELAAEKLLAKYPGISFCGFHDGYFKDDEEIIAEINASGADILFVCLGAPKQEFWAGKYKDRLSVSLTLCLGGALDSYAGTVKRAPDFMIKLGLEWLYRLIKQPSRAKRMLALPKYMFAVIFDSLKGEKRI